MTRPHGTGGGTLNGRYTAALSFFWVLNCSPDTNAFLYESFFIFQCALSTLEEYFKFDLIVILFLFEFFFCIHFFFHLSQNVKIHRRINVRRFNSGSFSLLYEHYFNYHIYFECNWFGFSCGRLLFDWWWSTISVESTLNKISPKNLEAIVGREEHLDFIHHTLLTVEHTMHSDILFEIFDCVFFLNWEPNFFLT